MTPDELDRLADEATPPPWTIRLDGVPPDEDRVAGIDIGERRNGSPEDFIETDGGWYGPMMRNARLIVLAPTLAREHAALLRWADEARNSIASSCEDVLLMDSGEGDSPRNIAANLRAIIAALDAVTGGLEEELKEALEIQDYDGTDIGMLVHEQRRRAEAEHIEARRARVAQALAEALCEAAEARADRLRERAERLLYIAEHLAQMVPQDVWREHGAEWMGQYEGDYHAEQVRDELGHHREALGGHQ